MDPGEIDPAAAAILLAATAAGDAEAREAALDPALRAQLDAALRVIAALRGHGRELALSTLVAAAAPRVSSDSPAPPRARAVMASLAAREVASRWVREASAPRVGFRASPALRTTLACTEDDAWRE